MVTKPYLLGIMTIKQLVPKMLLVVGVALTILVSAPSLVLAAPSDSVTSTVKQEQHTEAMPDGKGGSQGTRTTSTGRGHTTVTEIYTVGPNAGTTVTMKFGADDLITSKRTTGPDGSIENRVWDANHASIVTTTRPDGTVKTETLTAPGFGPGSEKVTSVSIQTPHPNGTVATQTIDPTTGKPTGLTLKDKNGNVTTTLPDGKGGFTAVVKGADGKVETIAYDAGGKLTGLTLKDKNGNVTAALPDGKGGFTSSVTGEHGKMATSSYDADGKLTGQTIKDKNGKLVSTTTVTPDGKGGSTSVTKDKNGKVVSSTVYDKLGNVVSQTGKKQIMTLGTSGQSTGGTQTSQGSGKPKDKHKLQAAVIHQDKIKSNVQDSGSSGASSGSGQQRHHRKH